MVLNNQGRENHLGRNDLFSTMQNENITSDALSGEQELGSADSEEAVSDGISIHETLSKALGKEFKDDETALKAVKDTFKYVGAVGQVKPLIAKLADKLGSENEVLQFMENMANSTQAPDEPKKDETSTSNDSFVSREQYEADMFFQANQDLAEHRELIEALQTKTGKPLSEVVELPAFKNVYEKAVAYADTEKSKSVLHSNPRIGQVTDKMTKARENLKAGNIASATDNAVEAVIDAYNLAE